MTDNIVSSSVDLLLCDPPYAAQYVELYSHIGRLAARVLKPGASLVTMTGQSHLNKVMRLLDEHLSYNWCLSYLTSSGGSTLIHQRKTTPYWKPVLHYCKGKHEGKMIYNVVQAVPPDEAHRTLHKWQQDLHGFEELVKRFSRKGDTVMDCCMGSGTTGVAAVKLGRKFIGCDIDESAVEVARNRIKEALDERERGE